MKSEITVSIGRHEHAGNNARHHQLPNRIGAERPQRVDLIGHDHRPQLRGDARADAAGEHQRRQHRPELLDHRRADQAADHRPRAELIQRQAALQRQRGAGEQAGQQHDGERPDADRHRTARRRRGSRSGGVNSPVNGRPVRRTYSCTSRPPASASARRSSSTRGQALRAGRRQPSSGFRSRLISSRRVAAFSKSRLAAAARICSCSDADVRIELLLVVEPFGAVERRGRRHVVALVHARHDVVDPP